MIDDMCMSKKLLVIGLIISAMLSGTGLLVIAAQAVPMTDQQVELIRNNCTSTKNTLNQLHSSDALLRVNVGQIYESMLTKLMERFNSRVTNSSLSNAGLATVSTSYGLLLDTFRADYMTYEKQLTSAINIDCSQQPAAFYDAVALARVEREQMHVDVINLDQSLGQYQLALAQFMKDNQAKLEGAQ